MSGYANLTQTDRSDLPLPVFKRFASAGAFFWERQCKEGRFGAETASTRQENEGYSYSTVSDQPMRKEEYLVCDTNRIV